MRTNNPSSFLNKTPASVGSPFSAVVFPVLLLLLVAASPVGRLFAVEAKTVKIGSFKEFREGEFNGTALGATGRLTVGPRVRQLVGPGREYYLSLAMTPGGDIYLGTGHQASVFRINAAPGSDKNIEKIWESRELDVYALLTAANGSVYAATSPDGKIYNVSNRKVGGGKKVKDDTLEFFNPEEKFIWDLKEDVAGNIYCAVGNSGGVYRLRPSGEGVKIFSPEDTHIVSLYITRDNAVLAGSGDRGILYRIDNRKARVLFDSPQEEIRGICEDREGNIYFSASGGGGGMPTSRRAARGKAPKGPAVKPVPPAGAAGKSVLYCLGTAGTVEEIWSPKGERIYSVVYDAASDAVIVGTGSKGRVYRVKRDGDFSLIHESESAQVYQIAGHKGGFTFIGNNTASVTTVENLPNNKGVYYSDIFDLGIRSALGRMYWESQGSVQLFVRSGHSNVPDNTWEQWSAPYSGTESALLNIDNCRYFQLKAVLNTSAGGTPPALDSLKVYYLQANLPPRVKNVRVTKDRPPAPVVRSGAPGSGAAQTRATGNHRINVTWTASDPNKDRLIYTLAIKKEGTRQWLPLKENLGDTKLGLDTRLFQDGKYRLRVTAHDSPANPPSMAGSGSLESPPFLIDSTAPRLSDFSKTGNRIRFSVRDQTSVIARVLYSYDGKHWFPVFPSDRINDSRSETFDFIPPPRSGPTNTGFIFLKVIDEFDNEKVFQEAY